MKGIMEKRRHRRPLEDEKTQELIKSRVRTEMEKIKEVNLAIVLEEQVTGRVINEFEHSDLYGLIYETRDRIDPFMTGVEDYQETKRLWKKYSGKYTKLIKFIKISLLILLGSVIDAKDRVMAYINMLFGPN